eukprot:CAMPEP_0170315832 /NCGR_PEP_ID=MMETSP0116_2-20130129/58525_1 /TAXON_ID=400756 /ORGANISM="Durinskia baltica, Strain CSIRO CS-38" /LENGTH=576 /DNA_ID=CAMNT_0010568353 /DNA_START=47 /DNA_END=1775 /DNA_ORIENTATION=-
MASFARRAIVSLALLVGAAATSAEVSSVPAGAGAAVDAVAADGSLGGLCLLQDARARGLRAGGRRMEVGPAVGAVTCDEAGASAFTEALAQQPLYWMNKNGDFAVTGASRFATRADISGGPSWSFKDETEDLVYAHPIIDAEKSIYLMHRNGKLRKFSADGEVMWTNSDMYAGQDAGKLISGTKPTLFVGGPVLLDGAIYLGDSKGFVSAVDATSGATRWRKAVGAASASDAWSMGGISGTLVAAMMSEEVAEIPFDVAGGQDMIVGVDAKDGSVLWSWKFPDGKRIYNALFSFASDPPSVLFSNYHGRAYRLKLCDGSVVWEGPAPELQPGESEVMTTGGLAQGANGVAYVTSNFLDKGGVKRGRLAAHNLASGDLLWVKRLDMPANNAPSIGHLGGASGELSVVLGLGENAFFPDPLADLTGKWENGRPVEWFTEVAAFSATNGEPTGWKFAPPPWKKTESEGDSWTGHICLPDAWSNAAIDADGTVYLGHMSGKLFALRDMDGDGRLDGDGEVRSYYGGRCYQGSPGIAEGMLVATPCDGMHVFKGQALAAEQRPPSLQGEPAARRAGEHQGL